MARRKLDIIRTADSSPESPDAAPVAGSLNTPQRRRKVAPSDTGIVAPAAPFSDDVDSDQDENMSENLSVWQRSPLWLRLLGGGIVTALLLAGSFELVYAGKIYPGVSADGVYLGGLSRSAAATRLKDKATAYTGGVITITQDDTHLRIPVARLSAQYDPARAAELAYNVGRQGDIWNQTTAQLRALIGHATSFTTLKYDPDRLTPYVLQLAEDIATPVQNASLNFNDNHAQVTPAQTGARLDLGKLVQAVADRLATTSSDAIPAPVYQLSPDLDTAPLQAATSQIDGYLSGPITLSYSGSERLVDQKTIINWIQVGSKRTKPFLSTLDVANLYPPAPTADLSLDQAAIRVYVADLAKGIDQIPRNAALSMQDNQLTITQPSRTGIKLDQTNTIAAITTALDRSPGERYISLKLDTTMADVNETNLDSLGIKEQISQGETYFPGSPSTRLTNIRTGAARFNGVLLKPGEEFSFGKLLGEVGPETGYVPELVILADHEEKQYGGGLCQVSSTAFRAALAAGLPITERHNHSFAISYYTWPYSAPGVDATIYYPGVDFKFINDTGHYILIQTTMKGVDLKFDFFGTKTKSGVIRGPEFITGDSDTTKPSHTVFYRDILDLSGNVTKTDTFHTYYKSSKDFPITPQYN